MAEFWKAAKLRDYANKYRARTPHGRSEAASTITALHCAVWEGDLEAARVMLENEQLRFMLSSYTGCSPTMYCELPIHYAARKGDVRMMELLRGYGADFMARTMTAAGNLEGPTVLACAITSGNPKAVQIVLDAHPEKGFSISIETDGAPYEPPPGERSLSRRSIIPKAYTRFGITPLQLAFALAFTDFCPAWYGDAVLPTGQSVNRREVVKVMLALPAISPDCTFGQPTPLYIATKAQDMELVHLLLRRSADPMYSVRTEATDLITREEKASTGGAAIEYLPPLYLAIRTDIELASEMLEYTNVTEVPSRRGESSLLVEGIKSDDAGFVELLLDRGAIPLASPGPLLKKESEEKAGKHRGKRGWSPLMTAASRGNVDIVEALLQGIRNFFEELPERIWDIEHRTKPHVNEHEAEMETQLYEYYIAVRNEPDMSYESEVNFPEQEQGLTALHVAAQRGLAKVAEVLLKAGAKVNIPAKVAYCDTTQEAPIHLALRQMQSVGREKRKELAAVVRILMNAGADVDQADTNGVTPRQLAVALDSKARKELKDCRALFE